MARLRKSTRGISATPPETLRKMATGQGGSYSLTALIRLSSREPVFFVVLKMKIIHWVLIFYLFHCEVKLMHKTVDM